MSWWKIQLPKIRWPRIPMRITKPRPTVLAMDLGGTFFIWQCCVALGANEDVLPIAAGWIGSMLVRLLDILKDDEDEVATLRINIIVGAWAAGAFALFLCHQYADHTSLMVPVMTAFAAAYGAVTSKLINNENELADAFKGGSSSSDSGCRYPGGE